MTELIGRKKGASYSKRTLARNHYEDMWSSYDKCKDIVKHGCSKKGEWLESNPVQIFKQTSNAALAELMCWIKETFKGSKEKLKKPMHRIKELHDCNRQYKCGEELKSIERYIHHFLLDEEIF